MRVAQVKPKSLGGYKKDTMRIGILIVGSLYWDGSATRCQWRRDRLSCSGQRTVRAPIRYGRKSTSRGNTFTMVFAQSCSSPDKLGTGLVLPARAECCEPEQLVAEAEYLWGAERNSRIRSGVAADWGRVCLVHPRDRPLPEEFRTAWAGAVRAAGAQYRHVPMASGEQPLIGPVSGIAQFEWPTDAETDEPLSDFDVLLLTATEPTLTNSEYASAREVADAWRADATGHVSYFYNNRQHGIRTFEDDEIERRLKGEPPNTGLQAAGPAARS